MKQQLALIFGGRSPEHEVSLSSARGIYANLDRSRYEIALLGVDRHGAPRLGGEELLQGAMDRGAGVPVCWPTHPEDRVLRGKADGAVLSRPIDVAFGIIHGAGGEDGTLQGLLALAGIPCVGPGVLGSALAMDKDRAKRVLAAAGIPVAPDVVFEGADPPDAATAAPQIATLGYPVFVKPARAGSSVGVSKVKSAAELAAALRAAHAIDTKILVERAVPVAREIETAVLGNLQPEVSICGEIVPHGEFYSYDAKYNDPESRLLIPAPLDDAVAARIRELAARAFRALDLAGMARIDFLLSSTNGELVLNEANTLPGFTPISMYPKLWEASGLSYARLLDRLITLACEAARCGALRSA